MTVWMEDPNAWPYDYFYDPAEEVDEASSPFEIDGNGMNFFRYILDQVPVMINKF